MKRRKKTEKHKIVFFFFSVKRHLKFVFSSETVHFRLLLTDVDHPKTLRKEEKHKIH